MKVGDKILCKKTIGECKKNSWYKISKVSQYYIHVNFNLNNLNHCYLFNKGANSNATITTTIMLEISSICQKKLEN